MTIPEAVEQELKENHKGFANVIRGKHLVDKLQEKYNIKIDRRELRTICADLIQNSHSFVGSCSIGYFYIVTQQDFDIAYAHKVSLFEELRKTAVAMKFNWETRVQMEMPL